MCGTSLTADGGAHFFTAEHTGKPHVSHQSRDRASGHAEAFPLQLAPDLSNVIDAVVFVVYALYLLLKKIITSVTLTAFFWMLMVVLVPIGMSTRLYSAHGIPVRPCIHRAECSAAALFFPEAIELRLRKISRGLPQNIVAAPQLTVLALQFFQALTFSGGQYAITTTGIALLPAYPGSERLG